MRLADGETQTVNTRLYDVNIELEQTKSHMHRGIDFILAAGIVIDFTMVSWYFGDQPQTRNPPLYKGAYIGLSLWRLSQWRHPEA